MRARHTYPATAHWCTRGGIGLLASLASVSLIWLITGYLLFSSSKGHKSLAMISLDALAQFHLPMAISMLLPNDMCLDDPNN